MSEGLAYLSDAARRSLVYRLVTVQAPQRWLLIGAPSELARFTWSTNAVYCQPTGVAGVAGAEDGRFDAIALAGVLRPHDSVAPGLSAHEFIAQVVDRLAPNGVLMGHLDHGMAARHLGQWWRCLLPALRPSRSECPCTPTKLRRILSAAKLGSIECFYLTPSMSSPMGLVPCTEPAATRYFRRAIVSARDQHSWPAYIGRRLAAQFGWSGIFRQELFFWARKSC